MKLILIALSLAVSVSCFAQTAKPKKWSERRAIGVVSTNSNVAGIAVTNQPTVNAAITQDAGSNGVSITEILAIGKEQRLNVEKAFVHRAVIKTKVEDLKSAFPELDIPDITDDDLRSILRARILAAQTFAAVQKIADKLPETSIQAARDPNN